MNLQHKTNRSKVESLTNRFSCFGRVERLSKQVIEMSMDLNIDNNVIIKDQVHKCTYMYEVQNVIFRILKTCIFSGPVDMTTRNVGRLNIIGNQDQTADIEEFSWRSSHVFPARSVCHIKYLKFKVQWSRIQKTYKNGSV